MKHWQTLLEEHLGFESADFCQIMRELLADARVKCGEDLFYVGKDQRVAWNDRDGSTFINLNNPAVQQSLSRYSSVASPKQHLWATVNDLFLELTSEIRPGLRPDRLCTIYTKCYERWWNARPEL